DPLPDGVTARLGTVRLRHAAALDALVYSPDGKLLATSAGDGQVILWRLPSGDRLHRFPGGSRCLVFSPDGKFLAGSVGFSDGKPLFKVWEVVSGKEVLSAPGAPFMEGPNLVAFTPDGKSVATVLGHSAVRVWDLATGARTEVSGPPRGTVRALGYVG